MCCDDYGSTGRQVRRVIMTLATMRDAGRREALAERDQFAATGGAEALAEAAWEPRRPGREEIAGKDRGWMQEERAKGYRARTERSLSGAQLVETTTAEVIEGIPVPSAAHGGLAIVSPLAQ